MVFRNYLMFDLVSLTALSGYSSEAAETHAQPTITEECNAYSGWEAIAEKARTHIIMFGEMHGTNESPEAIRGVLCELVKTGTPIRFGVEAEHWQGDPLDAALATTPIDRESVQAAAPAMWAAHDGRSSQAVYDLLEQIAAWRGDGADIHVFAFDFSPARFPRDKTDGRSTTMARMTDNAATGFEGAILLFAGGYHTVLNASDSGRVGGSLASEVTVRPALSLSMVHSGGEAYVTYSRGGSETITGILSLQSRQPEDAPDHVFDLTPTDYSSGYYYTGPITPSPPAFPGAEPP